MYQVDTIAAISTPPGEGGIAIIRVSGPDALSIADRVFQGRDGTVTRLKGYTLRYGVFFDANREIADDGLLTVFRAPYSYTGEDTIELSCHGGRTTTSRVLALTLEAGARLAAPGEFTLRAFLNGKLDLAQAEAVSDLIRARTESARRVARRHLDGALSDEITAIKEELIGILAAIEVTIDFSDEVGDLEYGPLLGRIETALAGIATLLATASRGRILREGLRVAIVGRPNVGKSSLLNRLLSTDRAIVTPIAGTTRDLLEESASIEGVPVILVDTAGMRDTADIVERIGVERAEAAAAQADVVMIVIDAAEGITHEDRDLMARIPDGVLRLLVWNKCDLLAASRSDHLIREYRAEEGAAGAVAVSARTGDGIGNLEQALLRTVKADKKSPEMTDDVVVANVRHVRALEQARLSLAQAVQTTMARLPGDFIAIDVRGALDALGQITGETVNEEIIHRIFHDFCVGK
jgi:tRNA modification GTPase